MKNYTCARWFSSSRTMLLASLLMIGIGLPPAYSQQPDWQKHLDWAAHNTDAGGSVDCPNQYIGNGVA